MEIMRGKVEMKTDDYPLFVHALPDLDSGNIWGWYSKGHHAPEDLIYVVGYEWPGYLDRTPKPEDVQHKHWRNGLGHGPDGPCRLFYDTKPGPGAFPVTVLER